MQVTTLHALNGDLGSASKYHLEELSDLKNSNKKQPANRYYIDEPGAVAEIFDAGKILTKFMPKKSSGEQLEDQLLAIEKALAASLDKKGKNAVEKLQSTEFDKMRIRLQKINRQLKENPPIDPVRIDLENEAQKIKDELSKVKEPVIARDFTLTLEKSFSIAFALADSSEKQIWIDCFKQSCKETLEMIITEYMKTNSKHPTKADIENALERSVYAIYVHFKNREGHPHLHAHGVIYNLLKELEGDKLSHNNFPIMFGENFQLLCKKADTHLHQQMKVKLNEKFPNKYRFSHYTYKDNEKIDFREIDPSDDITNYWDGIDIAFTEESQTLIKSLSKFADEVNQEVEEIVKQKREERDELLLNCKDILDKEERAIQIKRIISEFKSIKHYYETEWRRQRHNELKPQKSSNKQSNNDFDDIADKIQFHQFGNELWAQQGKESLAKHFPRIVSRLTENKHHFTEMELEVEALKYGLTPKEAKDEIKKLLNSKHPKTGRRLYEQEKGFWLSRINLDIAVRVEELSVSLSGGKWKNLAPLSQNKIDKLSKKLNKDQVDAVKLCLNDSQLNIIAGLPGVGKSTVLKKIVEEIEGQVKDLSVFKLSTSGKIVEQLKNDIPQGEASTLASFKIRTSPDYKGKDKIKLTSSSLIVIDEAGMVEDEHYLSVLAEAKRVGAKVILVGDDRQLSSVGRGDSFTNILNANRKQTVRINEILRQKNSSLRSIVSTMAGSGVSDQDYREMVLDNSLVKKTFLDLEAQRMVEKFSKSKDLYEQIAQDYLADKVSDKEKLIIASSNNEVSKINNRVQDLLFKGKDTRFVSQPNSNNSYFVGDKVILTKQVKKYYKVPAPTRDNPDRERLRTRKVTNGKLGTVLNVDEQRSEMWILFEDENGTKSVEKIDLKDPTEANSISLGYATTVHKSQGLSIESIYIAVSDNEMLNSAENLNVAISRAKQNCKVYMLGQYRDRIVESHKADDTRTIVQNTKQRVQEQEQEMVELVKTYAPSSMKNCDLQDYLVFLRGHLTFNGKEAPADVADLPAVEAFLQEHRELLMSSEEPLNTLFKTNKTLFNDVCIPPRITHPTDADRFKVSLGYLTVSDDYERDFHINNLQTAIEELSKHPALSFKNAELAINGLKPHLSNFRKPPPAVQEIVSPPEPKRIEKIKKALDRTFFGGMDR